VNTKGDMLVKIEPSVLVWARQSIGKSIEEIARKADTSVDVVRGWEAGKKSPTIRQLKIISKYYKRPLAALLLAEPPDEPSLPTDFRVIPENRIKPFSEKTILSVRRARRLQGIFEDLAESVEFLDKTKIKRPPKKRRP